MRGRRGFYANRNNANRDNGNRAGALLRELHEFEARRISLRNLNENCNLVKSITLKGLYNFSNGNVMLGIVRPLHGQSLRIVTCKISHCDETIDYEQHSRPTENKEIIKFNLNPDRNIFRHTITCEVEYEIIVGDVVDRYIGLFKILIPYFRSTSPFEQESLPSYNQSAEITKLFKTNFDIDIGEPLLFQITNYLRMSREERVNKKDQLYEMFHIALDVNDLEEQKSLDRHSLNNVILKRYSPDHPSNFFNMYSLHTDADFLQKNFREYSVCLIPMSEYDPSTSRQSDGIVAPIIKYYKGKAYFKRATAIPNHIGKPYHLEFIANRTGFRAAHHALATIQRSRLAPFLLDFKTDVEHPVHAPFLDEDFEWKNKGVKDNLEQMEAIKNVVNCSAFPAPYIIFGPPGTGKTSTLVEAVTQILKLKPKSKILITAQANSACDEIGVRLLKYVSRNKIYRYFSPSAVSKVKDIDPDLISISNLRNEESISMPSYEELYHFNVVIVTLVSSSHFNQASIDSNHFDYIFIDECAAATEPEALIPISGQLFDGEKISCQIVLLGDHKQLGPIMESRFASDLCLGVSLMERMMHMDQYSNDNPKYVTQLLDNYRSHPAILKFSNDQFYDGKLRARLPKEFAEFAFGWKLLPNKNFPIILHASWGKCLKQKNGTSFYNKSEVDIVQYYVKELLANGINGQNVEEGDIGIVSPYSGQQYGLKMALEAQPNIEIGTAEFYQGREKKIIIISTVKSDVSIGFLKEEKRMNVALTRAKCLMILVCNPKTLQKDPLWYEFVKYCKENNACAGKRFELINHGEDNNADNTEDINGTSDDEILKFLKQVE